MSKKKHVPYVARTSSISSTSMTPTTTLIKKYLVPTVYYTEEAKATIDYLVAKARTEIGWLGLVEKLGVDFLIKEIIVPKQVVSAATTEITAEDFLNAACALVEAGKNSEELYYWGHSHVRFAVAPSTQDELQVEEYLSNVDFFIRGIYNKFGDSKVDVYDVTRGVVHQCVDDKLMDPVLSPEMSSKLDALVKESVTVKVFKPVKSNGGKHHGYRAPSLYEEQRQRQLQESMSLNPDQEALDDYFNSQEYLDDYAPGGPM